MLTPQQLLMVSKQDEKMSDYTKIDLLGKGNYGHVYLAQHNISRQMVAIKKLKKKAEKQRGLSVDFIRQISILKKLSHPNIIRLLDYNSSQNQNYAYLIFQYMPSDLQKQLKKGPIQYFTTKIIMRKMLQAVKFCHQNSIVHRDIKPSNILLNISKNLAKLGDFGIAKHILINPRKNTTLVSALYYRAPELILQDNQNSFPIDIWALGCVFAQCILGRILFASVSKTQLDQLQLIISKLQQKPQRLQFQDLRSLQNKINEVSQKKIQSAYPQLIKLLNADGLDLLNKMICLNPNNRITAEQALSHKYFQEKDYSNFEDLFEEQDQFIEVQPFSPYI